MPPLWIDCREYHPDRVLPLGLRQAQEYVFLALFNDLPELQALSGLVLAFQKAFGAGDAALVLYLPDGEQLAEALLEQLSAQSEAAGPDIQLLLEPVSAPERPSLLGSADCLISLGPGQEDTLLQALALNLPVLAEKSACSAPLAAQVYASFETETELIRLLQSIQQQQPRVRTRPWAVRYCNRQASVSTEWDAVYLPSMRHLGQYLNPTARRLWLTDEMSTAAWLEKEGFNFLLLQDYCSPADQKSVEKRASGLCENWHLSFSEALDYDGHALAPLCQYDSWYGFSGCLQVSKAFANIQQEVRLSSLSLANEFKTAQYWDPAFGPFPDPKHGVMRYLAEQKQIPVHLLPAPQQGWVRNRPPSRIPGPAIRSDTLFPTAAALQKLAQTYDRVVLGVGSDQDISELGTIPAWLWQQERILFLFFRKYMFPISQNPGLFFDLSFLLQWPEDQMQQRLRQKIADSWQAYQAAVTPEKEELPEIFANPHLDFQLYDLLQQIQDSARYIKAARLLKDFFEPDLCLAGLGASGTMKAFMKSLQAQQIPTISIFHGNRVSKEYQCPADLTLVKGHGKKQRMEDQAYPSRIEVLGDLREISIFKSSAEAQSLTGKIRTRAAERPVILLLTCQVEYGLYRNYMPLSEHFEDWHRLIDMMHKQPDWYFLLKPHPRYDYFDFYQLGLQLPNAQIADYSLKYAELIDMVDIVVLVNCTSTVVFEVCESQKPLVSMNHAYDLIAQSGDLPFGRLAADVGELHLILSELLSSQTSIQDIVALEKQILAQEKSYSQIESTANFKRILERELLSRPLQTRTLSLASQHTLRLASAFESAQIFNNLTIWQQAARDVASLSGHTLDASVISHFEQKLKHN